MTWKDFEDAGEAGAFAANEVIVAAKQIRASGRLRKNRAEDFGGDREKPLWFAAEIEARSGEDGSERRLARKNEGPEFSGKGIEQDLDEPVFHRRAGGGGVKNHLAKIDVSRLPGLEDGD